jgi:hypothetical protein
MNSELRNACSVALIAIAMPACADTGGPERRAEYLEAAEPESAPPEDLPMAAGEVGTVDGPIPPGPAVIEICGADLTVPEVLRAHAVAHTTIVAAGVEVGSVAVPHRRLDAEGRMVETLLLPVQLRGAVVTNGGAALASEPLWAMDATPISYFNEAGALVAEARLAGPSAAERIRVAAVATGQMLIIGRDDDTNVVMTALPIVDGIVVLPDGATLALSDLEP